MSQITHAISTQAARFPFKAKIELRTITAIVITTFLWASAFAGIRAGLQAYSPEHLALLRYIISSLVLAVYALVTRMPRPHWRDLPGMMVVGVIGVAFYNVALAAGEMSVSAGVASMIVAASPIFVALLAMVFLHERLRLWGWLGIGLSFTGVAVIASGAGEGLAINSGALWVLAAALAFAVFIVMQKPYLSRYNPIQTTTYAIWGATLALLIFSPGLARTIQAAPLDTTIAIVYMGVFPGALGFVTWAYVLARTPASIASSFLYLIPAFTIVIAWLWLGEVPGIMALVGGVLVLSGVILVRTRGKI